MHKKGLPYIITALILVLGLMLIQYAKPKNINWFESYVGTHKIPYGTYVANELLENQVFKGKIEQVYVPPFEHLSNKKENNQLYVFINNNVSFEEAELNRLLEWTADGNTLFIASESFEEALKDTLNFDIGTTYVGFDVSQKQEHELVNPALKGKQVYKHEKDNFINVFSELDTLNVLAVAKVKLPNEENESQKTEITAVKNTFGKGEVILSTFPKAFTNYFILKDNNREYTAGLFSYFAHADKIYLDNYYKSGKAFYTSPMYIFLNTKELKWAYYLVLIGGLLYIIFEGRRKQRAIPVIKPLQNQTLAFTRTISDMYFEKGDRKSIVEHKVNYFLNLIKNKYYVTDFSLSEEFYKNLAVRSGTSLTDTRALFLLIDELRNNSEVAENQLIKLNKLIQKFTSNG